MQLDFLAILFRWVHITTACVMVGSVFFFQVILPRRDSGIDAAAIDVIHARCRRRFKMTIHVSLLLFIITGIYNAWRNWPVYTTNPGVMHGMFGMHLLLGLGGITLLMMMLAGREPRSGRLGWARPALVLLLLGIGVASTLKSAREYALTHTGIKRAPSAVR